MGRDRAGIEYRYAEYPLPLGESVMTTHALFAGLLHSGATPITDERFHKRVLDLKIYRCRRPRHRWGAVIPGAEAIREWLSGKSEDENGLSYLARPIA